MSDALDLQRRFYAEELQAVSNLRTPGLVDALATVPREAFLTPGPWLVQGQADSLAGPRQTPDADPRHVYHNISVAIDPARQLFNGQPGLVASWIDLLGLRLGSRVLHVGSGPGYYTALLSRVVGPEGRVVAVEVDEALATTARAALAPYPSVEVRHANGKIDGSGETFDAVLVSTGVTHAEESWLDALALGGRLLLPLTFTMPAMGPIGKGPALLLSRGDDPVSLAARVVGFVAIYSALGLRDDELNHRLGEALKAGPYPPVKWLRRDPHALAPSCWHHAERSCLGT